VSDWWLKQASDYARIGANVWHAPFYVSGAWCGSSSPVRDAWRSTRRKYSFANEPAPLAQTRGADLFERASRQTAPVELRPFEVRPANNLGPANKPTPALKSLGVAPEPRPRPYLGNLNPPREYPKTRETTKSMTAM